MRFLRVLLIAPFRPTLAARSWQAEWDWRHVALVIGLISFLGALSLPRQLHLMNELLAGGSGAVGGLRWGLMRDGLTRLIVLDRVLPPAGISVAAVLLVSIASRPAHGAAVLSLGLLPQVFQRGLEALVVWWPIPPPGTLGEVVELPRRVGVGVGGILPETWQIPGLWAWEARLGLFAGWSVLIWTAILRVGSGDAGWRKALFVAAGALIMASWVTIGLSQPALRLVLGGIGP